MSLAGWRDNLQARWSRLTPEQKMWLKLGVLALFVLVSPSGGRLLGPLFLILFWSLASTENRTVSLPSIGAAAVWGLVVLIPAASVLETPILALVGEENLWSVAWCTLVELALVAGTVAALLFAPQSRLRLTGSILDFAVLGLAAGAGFEAGLGVLSPSAAGFYGVPLSVLPQLPGLLGHSTQSSAAASPASWGLLFGLLAGLARYLFGPDLTTVKVRLAVAALVLLLTAWLLGERLAYAAGAPQGVWSTLYALDLKGRLLVYLGGIGTGVIILVEWLLLHGRPHAEALSEPARDYTAAWAGVGERTSWYARVLALLRLEEARNLLRERLQAEEMRPLLSPRDHARLERRLEQIQVKEGEPA